MANAGPNQTAHAGSTVTLNGSASTTPSGVLSYSWRFSSRPARRDHGMRLGYTKPDLGVLKGISDLTR
ncbi:MAG: hypothetical protein ABSB35_09015 [Bryobacteraceae bacterium]